ncbi:MAG: hypothetical protein U0Y68_20275 [Blastocatellia bacterium]
MPVIVALRLARCESIGLGCIGNFAINWLPAFEVQVEMPAFNSGRAPWKSLAFSWGTITGLGSIRQAPQVLKSGRSRRIISSLVLMAVDILIEADGEGRLTHATYVAFPVKLEADR